MLALNCCPNRDTFPSALPKFGPGFAMLTAWSLGYVWTHCWRVSPTAVTCRRYVNPKSCRSHTITFSNIVMAFARADKVSRITPKLEVCNHYIYARAQCRGMSFLPQSPAQAILYPVFFIRARTGLRRLLPQHRRTVSTWAVLCHPEGAWSSNIRTSSSFRLLAG